MKPWFEREQEITEFKEPVAYKGLNISVTKTKVKPPYIATVKSPATGKEVLKTGGNTEQEALDSAKQAIDKREADAPKISAGGQTSLLFNTPSNDELLKEPTIYNDFYAKISKDSNGPTLVIGNEIYGTADLAADGFRRSDRRNPKKATTDALPQVAVNASNKLLSQMGIKMNGRYTMDIEGKYRDENEHTVYPLQFQSSTIHAGDKERMNRPGLTIGTTREDIQPWFQREVEEAEVIKFPEPENKVLDMPSVASYPDFMTGVADLKARRHKGDISQASHDKLYTDLIHRFMKKESFETPWFMRENTAEQTVDQLEKIAQQDPKKAGLISKAFDKVLKFTNKVLGQKPQQTENTAELAQDADLIKSKMAELRKLGDFKNEKKLETFLNKLFKTVEIQATGRANRETFQKRAGLRIELQKAVDLIAGKVNGTLEQLEQQYKKQKKDDRDVEIKTSPGDEKIRSAISMVLVGLITTYKAKYTDEKKFNQFEKLIFNFLKASKQGIIPLGSLVDAGSGNIKDAVLKTKFKTLSTIGFIDDLLDQMPALTGGAWGPGELGLAVLGSPVSKGDKGDIMVGNRKIEIKASNNPEKGGRINTSAVKTGKAGEAGATKAISNFFSKIGQKFNGKSIGVTKTGKPVNAYNVNSLSWMQAVNQVILQARAKRQDVIQFLDELATAAINVPAKGEIKFDFSGAVAEDGTVIPNGFRKEYLRVILSYYNKIEGVNDILIINPGNGNFNVVDATDIDSIMQKLDPKKKILGTGTTLINFTDSQAKLSPQLGVY